MNSKLGWIHRCKWVIGLSQLTIHSVLKYLDDFTYAWKCARPLYQKNQDKKHNSSSSSFVRKPFFWPPFSLRPLRQIITSVKRLEMINDRLKRERRASAGRNKNRPELIFVAVVYSKSPPYLLRNYVAFCSFPGSCFIIYRIPRQHTYSTVSVRDTDLGDHFCSTSGEIYGRNPTDLLRIIRYFCDHYLRKVRV